ncbi:hypothetical protein BDP27DRAFT_1399534 [Rhodocollybia butyracea]|uniref:Transmembrane protein n=1 Tax=Rhodocollybia butyracea TaxID=206335 RepID=A0A9P5UBN6_9AGAR|nr:hypothetical protein BDP27DRAFT_1399534 [Rhodocollybia butyracea]
MCKYRNEAYHKYLQTSMISWFSWRKRLVAYNDCFVAGRPQLASSVTLWEFFPTTSEINPTLVIGTLEWAQPIDTVAVSASGWELDNFFSTVTGTVLSGGQHCFFTASSSGECDRVQVADDGTTSTMTLTGHPVPFVLPVTALLPIFTKTATDLTIIESGTPTAIPTASEKSRNNILGPLLGGLLGGLTALVGVILAAVNFIKSRRRKILDYSNRPLAVESAIEPFTASGTSNRNITKVTLPTGVAPPSPIPQKTSRSQENVEVVHVAIGHQLEQSPPQENSYNQLEEYPHQANSVSGTLPPSYDQLSFVDRE